MDVEVGRMLRLYVRRVRGGRLLYKKKPGSR